MSHRPREDDTQSQHAGQTSDGDVLVEGRRSGVVDRWRCGCRSYGLSPGGHDRGSVLRWHRYAGIDGRGDIGRRRSVGGVVCADRCD